MKILRFILPPWMVGVRVMVFNATSNNISAISLLSVFLVRETGSTPGENLDPPQITDKLYRINQITMRLQPHDGPLEGWTNRDNNLWLPLEMHGELVGTKHLVFRNDYNVTTIFRNLQRRYLACMYVALFKHIVHYGPRSGFLYYIPINHIGTCWAALWVWASGNLTYRQ